MSDDVARAVREEATRWAVMFRRIADDDPCCTTAGLIAAAKLLDRAAEPAERGTVDLRPGRPRRPGPYPPHRDDGA